MTEKFIATKDFDLKSLNQSLSNYFIESKEAFESLKIEIIDTFDWRLFNEGKIIVKTNRKLSLLDISNNIETSYINDFRQSMPKFASQLSEGDLNEQIKYITEIRALIVHAKKEACKTYIKLFDEEKKTVCKIEILEFKDDHLNTRFLNLIPVRGYNKEFKNAKKALKEIGLKRLEENEYILSLEASEITPGRYSKKPPFYLNANDTSEKTIRSMITKLLEIMKQNEYGIISDIDTEFLHDFRICVRKARSLLSLFKEIFPEPETARLKQDLKNLGNMTNRLRDIDVYLLEEDYFRSMLSSQFQDGITSLFKSLKASRRNELKKISLFLKSDEYSDIKQNIISICSSSYESKAKNSDIPVLKNAKSRIFKTYKKIIKSGETITKSTPDDEIHELRIVCKKLRYLLEFFLELFPENIIKQLIKELKKLQDNLGLFNDLSVQKEFLMEKLSLISIKNSNALSYAASIGALSANLEIKQNKTRDEFYIRFKNFNSLENKRLYHDLFKN